MELQKISIHGYQFGIIRTQAFSPRAIEHLNVLPQTQASFAGIALLDGQTLTCYDLSACLGFPPLKEKRNLQSFVKSGNESCCFCFSGAVADLTLPDNALYSLFFGLSSRKLIRDE
jgi:hypothetical protein